MFRSTALALSLFVCPAIAASPSAQFDLMCSGTLTTTSALTPRQAKPYSSHYRIDLAAKKWCEAECKVLHDVAAVQPAQLTLQSEEVDTLHERSSLMNIVDRETGAHKILASSSSTHDQRTATILHWEGSCEPGTFSGFPDLDTKF